MSDPGRSGATRAGVRCCGAGVTFVEMMVAVVLFTLVSFGAWEMFRGGIRQLHTSSGHMVAMRNALILMEAIQQDLRQIAVLNKRQAHVSPIPLIPFSLTLSPGRRSFSLRKSTETDPQGSRLGSSFTIVTYQLVEHRAAGDVFLVRREEKTASGKPIPGERDAEKSHTFNDLLLGDITFGFAAKVHRTGWRFFLHVSLTAINQNPSAAEEPRSYLISNMFEICPADDPDSRPDGPPGFAKPFFQSSWGSRISKTDDGVISGRPGNMNPLDPPPDTIDRTGNPKNLPALPASPGALADPFVRTGAFPPLRRAFLAGAIDTAERILGFQYRGRLFGLLARPDALASDPQRWRESFSLDASDLTSQSLITQLNRVYERVRDKAYATEAVLEMGRAFRVYSVPGTGPEGMTTDVARRILAEG